jgi:hypothetical protein
MNMRATESGRMQRCAIASVTITLIAVLTAAADIQRHLRMEVNVAPPDPSRMIIGAPATKTYVGLLRNTGKSPYWFRSSPSQDATRGRGGLAPAI